MITDPRTPYPTSVIEARLRAATDGGELRLLDAAGIAADEVGGATQANMVLLGVAVQLGHVPVSLASLERAIELNGASVDANKSAVSCGRRWAVDQASDDATPGRRDSSLSQTLASPDLVGRIDRLGIEDSAIEATLATFAVDLVGFQGDELALQFLDQIDRVARSESAVAGRVGSLTESFARGYHKLLAYKDEYEVARLMLLPAGLEAARTVGGATSSVAWHLHPPMLKALGLDHKVKIGSWAAPAIRGLAAGKRLRGTRFDPFGKTMMRRTERSLPERYLEAIHEVCDLLTAENLDQAVEIAGLPDLVRGYEDLKLRRIAEFERELRTRLASLRLGRPSDHQERASRPR